MIQDALELEKTLPKTKLKYLSSYQKMLQSFHLYVEKLSLSNHHKTRDLQGVVQLLLSRCQAVTKFHRHDT